MKTLSRSKTSLVLVVLSLLFTLTVTALPQLPNGVLGPWPALDTPPPTLPQFQSILNKKKIPNIPVVNANTTCNQISGKSCNWSCSGCTRSDTDIVMCPNPKDWGLSFDDGPTNATIPLLDYLKQVGLKATFFVIGSRVVENPTILKRAVDEGHLIGLHTWSHPFLTRQTNDQIIAEIKWTEAAIQAAGGIVTKYMRPPFGDVDNRVRQVLAQLGYKVVIWNRDTGDWRSVSDPTFNLKSWVPGNFTQWTRQSSSTGFVSLEHDLVMKTAAEAPAVVPIVANAGFNIKPISSCNGDSTPYLDKSIQVTPGKYVPLNGTNPFAAFGFGSVTDSINNSSTDTSEGVSSSSASDSASPSLYDLSGSSKVGILVVTIVTLAFSSLL